MMITSDCKEYVTRSGQKVTVIAQHLGTGETELKLAAAPPWQPSIRVNSSTGLLVSNGSNYSDFDIVGPWVPEPSQRAPITPEHDAWYQLTKALPEFTKVAAFRLRQLAKIENGAVLAPVNAHHPQALNMMRYALDALNNPNPSDLWEGRYPHPSAEAVNGWEPFNSDTDDSGIAFCIWNPDAQYRRKPTQAQQIAEATGVDIAQVEKVLTHLNSEK